MSNYKPFVKCNRVKNFLTQNWIINCYYRYCNLWDTQIEEITNAISIKIVIAY